MNRKHLRWLLIGAVILGVLLILQSFIGRMVYLWAWERRPTPSPTEILLAQAAIQLSDLPQGWRQGDMMVESVPNAEGRSIRFYGTPNRSETWINVGQILLLYPDLSSAQQGYQEQYRQHLPSAYMAHWKEVAELEFSHHADEWHTACLPGSINDSSSYACRAVVRYQNLVIVMFGNIFEDRYLSMADFRAVLEAMDRRAVAALDEE
jgi:hypothetical protein